MCGRFINTTSIKKLKNNFFIVENSNLVNDNISYNIAPSHKVNVLLNNKNFSLQTLNWGISFFNKIDKKIKIIINSRLETVHEKILFKESYFNRRCIIPANGYYEWHDKNNIKTPYFIQFSNLETIYFAGLWKYSYINDSSYKTFSILTKKANKLIYNIHNRMPVVFNINEAFDYLNMNKKIIKANFVSIIEKKLDFYPVSKIVNSPNNNSQECIKILA